MLNKAIAAELGLSLSMLIQNSVETFAQNHSGEEFQTSTLKTSEHVPEQKLTPEQKKLVEEFSKLPVDTQKAFMKILTAINTK